MRKSRGRGDHTEKRLRLLARRSCGEKLAELWSFLAERLKRRNARAMSCSRTADTGNLPRPEGSRQRQLARARNHPRILSIGSCLH